MPLNRFDKVIGIRERPNIQRGDIVLPNKNSILAKQYGKRSKWIVLGQMSRGRCLRSIRDGRDGLTNLKILHVDSLTMHYVQRREIWKTGARIKTVSTYIGRRRI